jgi:Zn-dependent metalloprotease
MSGRFERLHFHAGEEAVEPARSPAAFRGVRGDAAAEAELGFRSDEAAARFYLDQIMVRDERPRMRSLSSPDRPERVPDLRLTKRSATPLNTQLLAFDQTHESIPVFGSKAVVELTTERHLVSADASLGYVQNVSSQPSLDPDEALRKVREHTGANLDASALEQPDLNFFQDPGENDDSKGWHLVWLYRNVPAAPAGTAVREGHGLAPSIRSARPRYNYLVDAHDGAIVYQYSATPTLAVPTRLTGVDENEAAQEFYGSRTELGFEFRDPLHDLVSYDLAFGDLDTVPVPSVPLTTESASFEAAHRAAVSAHVNAKRVQDFYKTVLGRDGINDAGMELVSVVNCTYPDGQPPPEWKNAVWWESKMWYGQITEGGRLVSLARYLDVIAHELTHGVTEFSSNLVYRDQSGALNESFSDILGIIIKNWWEAPDRDDVGTWDWELGPGLSGNGPLRDLSDPGRTGDPDHMDAYDHDPMDLDHGGVHSNSNIHNKCAYLLLTATDQDGGREFSVQDAAVLFYLTLARLAPTASFADSLQAMVDVAMTMYSGDGADRDRKVQAIRNAFQSVGIT